MQFQKLLMATAIFMAVSASVSVNAANTGTFTLSDNHDSEQSLNGNLSLLSAPGITVDRYDRIVDGETVLTVQTGYTGGGLRATGMLNPSEDQPITYILDFGESKDLDRVTLNWESVCRASDYTLSVSDDKENWRVVATVTESPRVHYDNFTLTDPADAVSGRYLKINLTGIDRHDYTANLQGVKIQRKAVPVLSITNRIYGNTEMDNNKNYANPRVNGNIVKFNEYAEISVSVNDKAGFKLNDTEVTVSPVNDLGSASLISENGLYRFYPGADTRDGYVDMNFSTGDMSVTQRYFVFDNNEYNSHNYISPEHISTVETTSEVDTNTSKFIINDADPYAAGAEFEFEKNSSDKTKDHTALLTLDHTYDLENLAIYWACTPKAYSISVSTDGENFTEIAAGKGDVGEHQWDRFSFAGEVKAKYVKIETDDIFSNYGLKLGAIKLYGVANSVKPASIVINSSNGERIALGKSTEITVTVFDKEGLPMTSTPAVNVTLEGDMADNFSANVDTETNNFYSGVWTPSAGSDKATFTATCGDLSATLTLQALIPAATSIWSDVNNGTSSAEANHNYGNLLCVDATDENPDRAVLYAEVYDQFGDIMDYPVTIRPVTELPDDVWNQEKLEFTPKSVDTPTKSYFKQVAFEATVDNTDITAERYFGLVNHAYLEKNYIKRAHFKSFRTSSLIENPNYNNLVPADDQYRFLQHGGEFPFENNGAESGQDHWLIAELDRALTLENFALYWDTTPEYYIISVSVDGEQWDEMLSVKGHTATHEWYRYSMQNPRLVRYVKIETKGLTNNNEWGLKLGAIQLYGPGDIQIPTAMTITSSTGTTLAAGETTTLKAEVTDQYGAVIENLDWSRLVWSKNENPRNEIVKIDDTYTATYTATSSLDATDDDLQFTATLTYNLIDEFGGETDTEATLDASITIQGFDIDHYLFDETLPVHQMYQSVNLAKYTADHTVVVTKAENSSVNFKNLFDGGKELTKSGNGFQLQYSGSPRDDESDLIIKLYNPADLEAIVIRWERACPDAYTIEISPNGKEGSWIQVAENTEAVDINPDNLSQFNRRFGIDTHDLMRYIRIHTTANQTGYGLKIMDVKAYGVYRNLQPDAMTLNPYVNLDYVTVVDGEKTVVTHSHPNTVVFFTENTESDFSEETIYLDPQFVNTAKDIDFNVGDAEIDYIVLTDNDENVTNSDCVTLDKLNHALKFHKAGDYNVEGRYTNSDGKTITASVALKAVHHDAMLTSNYVGLNVRLINVETGDEDHKDRNQAANILMSGRTEYDGGVSGSINLASRGSLYDVVIDLGNIIDIPAVEIYWEGACPVYYNVSLSRSENFDDDVTVTHEINYSDRRAIVDRPRFDRISVDLPEYDESEGGGDQPVTIMKRVTSRADDDEETPAASTSAYGSTTATRYIKIHNLELDPTMGDVWGAKLAEVTPYYDPETMTVIPTAIETVGSDINDDCAPVEFYNLQGLRIFNPAPGQIVIRRQGSSVAKIIIE